MTEFKKKSGALPAEEIVKLSDFYVKESEAAKELRMQQNSLNYDVYHGRIDMSHKLKGQSKEHLPRLKMGVEQIAQFLQQGLMDFGDFFSADLQPGIPKESAVFHPGEVKDLLWNQLQKANFYDYVLDSLKSGALGALAIGKVRPEFVTPRRFINVNDPGKGERLFAEKKKIFQLKLDLVPQRNFHIDPTGKGLYKVEEREFDGWELAKFAERFPGMFDMKMVEEALSSAMSSSRSRSQGVERNETEEDITTVAMHRNPIKVQEFWGHLVDPSSGRLAYERKRWLIADEKFLIAPPHDYPTWDNEDPYVVASLIRVPHSQWHTAIADAPAMLNLAVDEIFNLLVDSGLQDVFGLKQVRENWLDNPAEISDGIYPGQTLGVNAACPPGQKVVERIDTGASGAGEGLNAMNIVSGELNSSMLQNDLRTGTLPPRSTSATEVVEASNAITSVFTGVGKSYETGFVEKVMNKSWALQLAFFKDQDQKEVKALLGEKRFKAVMAHSSKQLFAKTFGAYSFKVFGITNTLNKIKDFRKLTSLLQSVGTNPQLMEAFIKKYDFSKLLGEVIRALDINERKILQDREILRLNTLEDALGEGDQPTLNVAVDQVQSQIPQAGGFSGGNFEETPGVFTEGA